MGDISDEKMLCPELDVEDVQSILNGLDWNDQNPKVSLFDLESDSEVEDATLGYSCPKSAAAADDDGAIVQCDCIEDYSQESHMPAPTATLVISMDIFSRWNQEVEASFENFDESAAEDCNTKVSSFISEPSGNVNALHCCGADGKDDEVSATVQLTSHSTTAEETAGNEN